MPTVPNEPPPGDNTRLGRELYEMERKDPELRSAAWELHRLSSDPKDRAHIEIEECEAFNVRREGMCKAALMPDGSCPYAHEHGDEFSARS